MTSSRETSLPSRVPHHLTASRRAVLQTAAWSVPVVSLAVAAPAFAGSGDGSQGLVTFTSVLFWRPTEAEIVAAVNAGATDVGYFRWIPLDTIMWITQVQNTTGSPLTQALQLDLAATQDSTTDKKYEVIDSGTLAVTPKKSSRAANGHLVLSAPPLADATQHTITTAIHRPDSLARGSAGSWSLTVFPPASGATVSLPIQTFTQYAASL